MSRPVPAQGKVTTGTAMVMSDRFRSGISRAFHALNSTRAPARLPRTDNAVPMHYQCSSFPGYALVMYVRMQLQCGLGAGRLIQLAQLGAFPPLADVEVLENHPGAW